MWFLRRPAFPACRWLLLTVSSRDREEGWESAASSWHGTNLTRRAPPFRFPPAPRTLPGTSSLCTVALRWALEFNICLEGTHSFNLSDCPHSPGRDCIDLCFLSTARSWGKEMCYKFCSCNRQIPSLLHFLREQIIFNSHLAILNHFSNLKPTYLHGTVF